MSKALEFYNFKGEKIDLASISHPRRESSWNTIFAISGAGRAFSASEMIISTDKINTSKES